MAPAAPRDEDADLIAAAAAAGSAGGRSSSSSKGGSGSAAATESLARSNLLRLETAELVREATLRVSPAENHRVGEARWAPSARRYVDAVREAVTGLGGATLGPEAAAFPPAEGDGRKKKGRLYRVPLESDKHVKSARSCKKGDAGAGWTFPFAGGESLDVVPVGSFGADGSAGLAARHANGGVVPVLDLAVLFGGGDGGFVGGKDYLNHRYTDKRNILAVHVARQLSQKKHRKIIGEVHLCQVFGDARKVGLLLTPPDEEPGKKDSKKKKRKRGGEAKGGEKKAGKLRFRVRLIFGVKPTVGADSGDDDDSDASSPWLESWIPPSRLLPDRRNNRPLRSKGDEEEDEDHEAGPASWTPHYTNALAEDLHLVRTSDLVDSTIATLTPDSGGSTPFHEALLLLKVWSLQRGLLRGHDSFTTTSLAAILVYLYRTKAVGRRMGRVQVLSAFMRFWSSSDWLGEDGLEESLKGTTMTPESVLGRKIKWKRACVIPAEGRNESQTVRDCAQAALYREGVRGRETGEPGTEGHVPPTLLDCYRAAYASPSCASASVASDRHGDGPVLLDPTMTVNYLGRLSAAFVRESRDEARAALRAIHGAGLGGGKGAFGELFLTGRRFWGRYDAYLRLPVGTLPGPPGGKRKKKEGADGDDGDPAGGYGRAWGADGHDLGHDESLRRGIVGVLRRALGDRAASVRILSAGNGDASSAPDPASSEGGAMTRDGDGCRLEPVRGAAPRRGYASLPSDRPAAAPTAPGEGGECVAVGIRIDPSRSRRVVDRGPPAEDADGTAAFRSLWGDTRAQLRRFRDGAIVRAVVWDGAAEAEGEGAEGGPARFAGADRCMGGIVERAAGHAVRRHFSRPGSKATAPPSFGLRDMASLVDGVAPSSPGDSPFADPSALHRDAMGAYESLAGFLRRNSAAPGGGASSSSAGGGGNPLGLPLPIDEVEPLSPSLRYSSLFPPSPHPLLGGDGAPAGRWTAGTSGNGDDGGPMLVQVRFRGSSRWPASLNAMGAAKCAMLVRLADGIEGMRDGGGGGGRRDEDADSFDGPIDVTPAHLDLGYRGYSFRIVVRADQELRMLRGLRNPTPEARALRESLINRHVRGAMHHSLIHAVHTRHPSSSYVVRLARRWVASHMLSDMIPHEAVELLVASLYTEPEAAGGGGGGGGPGSGGGSVDQPPSTVVSGFLRFLRLLSGHDWAREPLIVDPQGHIPAGDRSLAARQFGEARGDDHRGGPAMYVVSPADYDGVEEMAGSRVVGEGGDAPPPDGDRAWRPTVTAARPERVVLARAAALAGRSHSHLTSCLAGGGAGGDWAAAFRESPSSLTAYSALLRVDPSLVADGGCSSTGADCSVGPDGKSGRLVGPFERSMERRHAGPRELRRKNYKNLVLEKDTLHEWRPVQSLVAGLRSAYGRYAVFFYNELAPDVIALLWRPDAFRPVPFSALVSESKRPVLDRWTGDSLVVTNADDVVAEIVQRSRNVITTFKVLVDKKPDDAPPADESSKKAKKAREDDIESESSEGNESEEEDKD